MLQSQLTIDPDTVPERYARLISLPWVRIYTLNVDDLLFAVGRAYGLARPLLSLSALGTRDSLVGAGRGDKLETVYLNGMLEDAPDGLTFSGADYASKQVSQDPYYAQCAVDVLARPVLYIGTPLEEPALWYFMKRRERTSTEGAELRRKSVLVSPSIDEARLALLEDQLNIEHLALTFEEFSERYLPLAEAVASEGHEVLCERSVIQEERTEVPLAADLAAGCPDEATDYLIGQEPQWSDLRVGRAIKRGVDAELLEAVAAPLEAEDDPRPRVILLSGTAGAGRSSTCMRLALELVAKGVDVGWVDKDVEISPLNIRRSMTDDAAPSILILDDADRYGGQAANMAAEISSSDGGPVVVLSVRSSRVDRLVDRLTYLRGEYREFVMPLMDDQDIDGLLDLLDSENRLGVLKGLPRDKQVLAFRVKAGRQLIVAMLEATSGRRFEERLIDEMSGLEPLARKIYAIAAAATAISFGLRRDEVVLAVGETRNEVLVAIDDLTRRHLLVLSPRDELRVRHRLIADVLVRDLARSGEIIDAVNGLTWAAATKIGPTSNRSSRDYRRVRSLMNHDRLNRLIGANHARNLYGRIEPLLHWDHHFWLQRGSLELEKGEPSLAENFLNQSYSLEPGDPLVRTEMGYLKLTLAAQAADGEQARELRDQGFDFLRGAMSARAGSDPHQYDIYVRLGLQWLRRGDVLATEREEVLHELARVIDEGRKLHPTDHRIRKLYVKVTNAQLGLE
jgi:hypothetical protein